MGYQPASMPSRDLIRQAEVLPVIEILGTIAGLGAALIILSSIVRVGGELVIPGLTKRASVLTTAALVLGGAYCVIKVGGTNPNARGSLLRLLTLVGVFAIGFLVMYISVLSQTIRAMRDRAAVSPVGQRHLDLGQSLRRRADRDERYHLGARTHAGHALRRAGLHPDRCGDQPWQFRRRARRHDRPRRRHQHIAATGNGRVARTAGLVPTPRGPEQALRRWPLAPSWPRHAPCPRHPSRSRRDRRARSQPPARNCRSGSLP